MVELLAPVRERYAELRPDEAALEAVLAAGAEKARAIAAPTLADVRERMGFGPRQLGAIPPARYRVRGTWLAMSVAELDLDLDIFAGPFDLLMAVVLREEVEPARVCSWARSSSPTSSTSSARASWSWRWRPSSSS